MFIELICLRFWLQALPSFISRTRMSCNFQLPHAYELQAISSGRSKYTRTFNSHTPTNCKSEIFTFGVRIPTGNTNCWLYSTFRQNLIECYLTYNDELQALLDIGTGNCPGNLCEPPGFLCELAVRTCFSHRLLKLILVNTKAFFRLPLSSPRTSTITLVPTFRPSANDDTYGIFTSLS